MPKTDLETLTVSFEATITKFERTMQKLVATTSSATGRARKANDDAMKAMEDRTGKAADRMNANLSRVGKSGAELGRNIQNASFQIGDFFVQVASGQSAMRAAAQQLPQLLGGFGVWGAVAGAAVAALSAMVGSMDIFGSKASETAKNYKEFLDIADGTKEITDAAGEGIATLATKLAQMDEVARRAFAAGLRKKISEETDQLKSAITTTSDELEGIYNELFDPDVLKQADFDRVEGQFESIFAVLEKFPDDPAPWNNLATAARTLADQLEQVNPGATDAIEKLRSFADTLDQNAGRARTASQDIARHREELRLTQGDAQAGAAGVKTFTGSVSALSPATIAAGDAVKYLRAQFGALSQQQKNFVPSKAVNFGFVGPGQDQLMQGLKGLEGLDNVFNADLTFNPDAQAFLDAINKPLKEKKGGGKKKTPADRAEDKTQQLKEEIAYNQQLAVAYSLGEAAMRKVTAAYEALKSARAAGLEEGSAEYQKYVDEATAANLVNLELEHRLDLMKAGKALHESLMTDQERQNKQLADYDAMLKAGAISQTDYERAVAKAKDTNEALTNAISGVGDAIQSGIQGATSFADALQKIGIQLLTLAARGLFGEGPLGGIINGLMGVAAGGVFGTPTAGATGGVGAPTAGLGTGFRRSFAAGGMAGPGSFLVGENGPEILNTARRGYVTPSQATRRLLGGGAGNSGPIEIHVNGARGNQEIAQMVAVGVAQGVELAGRNVPNVQRNYNLRYGP